MLPSSHGIAFRLGTRRFLVIRPQVALDRTIYLSLKLLLATLHHDFNTGASALLRPDLNQKVRRERREEVIFFGSLLISRCGMDQILPSWSNYETRLLDGLQANAKLMKYFRMTMTVDWSLIQMCRDT